MGFAERSGAVLQTLAEPGLPKILLVTHAWGGGVQQHIDMLLVLLQGKARVLVLRPAAGERLELRYDSVSLRIPATDRTALVDALKAIAIDRVHLHHVNGFPADVLTLDRALAVPLDVTLHDFFVACPQYQFADHDGRYCGEPDDSGCRSCLDRRPHAWALPIADWRAAMATTLGRAERIFAPSQSVADRLHRYFPELHIEVLPHADVAVAPPRVVKVALLGALAASKGLRAAVDVATYAMTNATPLTVRLLGHAAEPLPPMLTATGSYEPGELPRLIGIERPDVLWLPSQVPETYSFTLTAALASGLPIVASDIGALRDRLQNNDRARLVPFDASPHTWHDSLLAAAASDESGPGGRARDERVVAVLSGERWLDRYLPRLPASRVEGNPAKLLRLLQQSAALTTDPPAANVQILDSFRIGVYGGHRPSVLAVEGELATVGPGEHSVVGRKYHEDIVDDLQQQFTSANAHITALETSCDELRDVLDASDSREQGARERIAMLEREATQVRQERDELLASSFWRMTRPLRQAVSLSRDVAHVVSVSARLLRRSPALLRGGMARYRRGGLPAVTTRLLAEYRNRPQATANALPALQPSTIAPLRFPEQMTRPVVSIVVPVYGQHETTFGCLHSIAANPPRKPYEIVVMDDCSPEPAAAALAPVSGIRVLRNERNLGFIGNVNAGAQAARGDWLIILNNDTVVRPGALDALLDTFAQHDNVGLVGAKLLNADGSIQEAGGIVWRDGSAWNWGRGQHRDDPRFNYVRDVDYCSGAALAIRRDLFLSLGGFDKYYAPAYYEDTDLAFQVRAHGLRVLYQPAAEIFHLEGVSHGRDENSGIKAHQVTNAGKFFERWQATLANHRDNAVEPEQEAHRGTRSNILIVEACMITPDQDSGSVRLLNMLRILRGAGHHVTFVADNLDGNPRYAAQLTAMGVEVMCHPFVRSVRALLTERGKTLDTIVFCRHYIASQYLHSVRKLAPKARVIFDTVDLHFVREEREAQLTGNASMLRSAASTRARELATVAHSDATLVVSRFEQELLARLLPQARVEIVSNIHQPTAAGGDYASRNGLLFVGGFRHPPNVDAVKWYATEILPHIRKLLPGVVTTIVGSNMPDDIARLAQDGLKILGYVEDTAPLLRAARVSIAPLRFGAGVKGKVNEAMNHGVPVVATACAVEGMKLCDGTDVLVADDPRAFAEAVARVYNDADLWRTLARAGIDNVQANFSPESAAPAIKAIFG